MPEYTYMDPRGLGDWNMRSLSTVEEAVWAMDDAEAGKIGNVSRTDSRCIFFKYSTFIN